MSHSMTMVRIALANIRIPATPAASIDLATNAIADASRQGAVTKGGAIRRWCDGRRGAQVVFHPFANIAEPGSYRPHTFGDPANTFHEKAILCRAAENTCYFASVNCASDGCGITSAIARPDGTLLCYQPYGQEGLLVADLDLTAATGLLAARCRDDVWASSDERSRR